MNEIKVAFVGAGNMAREHARAFSDIQNVKLSGFYSRTPEKASVLATLYETQMYGSIHELYVKSQADLVVVTVPVMMMTSVLKEVFKYPWKVLAEKPVGYDLHDALKIQDEIVRSERSVFVALNRRHYSSTLTLLKELENREGCRYIHIHDQEDQAAARNAGQPEIVLQNWMYANSIHLIDLFTILGRGEIVSVDPVIKWQGEKPHHVLAKISYSSGDIGVYEAVWNRPGPWYTHVTVDDSRWEMRPLEQLSSQVYGSRKLEPVDLHEFDSKFKPGLRQQAEEAIRAVKGESHNLATFESAMKSMKLVSQIYG